MTPEELVQKWLDGVDLRPALYEVIKAEIDRAAAYCEANGKELVIDGIHLFAEDAVFVSVDLD